jgi:hypothetical protein
MIASMISAAPFEVVGLSPFAAGTRQHASIPAQMVPRRIADLTAYNTSLCAELRNRPCGAAVRRERWNTTQ